jgi:hypothetical protein
MFLRCKTFGLSPLASALGFVFLRIIGGLRSSFTGS